MIAKTALANNSDELLLEAQALLFIEPETDEDKETYLQDVSTFLSQVQVHIDV